MPAVNEIFAPLGNRMETTTATVYQYNSGMILRINGPELPENYRVDFANSVSGQSKSMLGGADGVLIPYEYFVPGSYIHAWVVLTGEDYAVTRYHITIPISPRAMPTEEQPSPEQESYIDQTIAALNDGVERAETAAENAEQAVANVQETVDTALQDAKDSGEFDGPQGEQGVQGDPGDPGAMLAFSPPTIERVINNGKVRAGSIYMPFAAYIGTQQIPCRATSFASTEWTVQITQATDSSNGQIRISWGERTVGTSLPKTIRFDFTFNNITVTCNVPVTHVYDGATGATGPQGEPGTSPEISIAPISGGHRITITDVDGTKTVDVMDGENGVGISSIVKTGTSGLVDTYTITYTNGNTTTFAVTNGEDGAPGVSPVITVTDITGGHRVTIADKEHPQGQSFDVMDGAGNLHVVGYEYIDDDVPQLIDATYADISAWLYANEIVVLFTPAFGESFYPAYTDRGLFAFRNIGGKEFRIYSDNTCEIIDDEYVTESGLDDALAGMPKDVQVNGTSVVTDGVANVPIGANATGVVNVSTNTAYGLQINSSTGFLQLAPASESDIKSAGYASKPIGTTRQHIAAFYGLAKAAGDTTQSQSSNAVGQYTDSAKSAIQNMLGLTYKEVGTLTLDEDKNVWDVTFEKSVKEALFVATFVATAQNTAEKDASFELLDINGNVANGNRATAKYACRTNGSIKIAIFAQFVPEARVAQISAGAQGVSHFNALGILTNNLFEAISGLHLFAPSGFYFAAGSTVTMYAKM